MHRNPEASVLRYVHQITNVYDKCAGSRTLEAAYVDLVYHASDVRYIGLYTSVHKSRKIDCDERSSGYVSKNRVSHHRYKLMYSLYVEGYNLYHRYFLGWNCTIAWLVWWLSWR